MRVREFAMQGFRPEIDLLLSCARACPDPAAYGPNQGTPRIRNRLGLSSSYGRAPWPDSSHLSEFKNNFPRVSPLLHNGTDSRPIPGQRGKKPASDQKTLRDLKFARSNGNPAIPFKGPVLASSLYGNLALRTFSDLDILVLKKDIAKAKDVLLSSGLQWECQLTAAQKANYLQNDYGCLNFSDKRGRIFVDLDRGLSLRELPWSFDLEHFARRLTRVSLEGKMVPAFSPEDLLLILCLHGAKHYWTRLSWVCDLAELIRVHAGLDWGRVLEEAAIQGCRRMLLLGLFIAHQLLGTGLPEGVLVKSRQTLWFSPLAIPLFKSLYRTQTPQWGHGPLFTFTFG